MKLAIARGGTLLALALTLAGCISLGGGKAPPYLLTLTAQKQVAAGAGASGNSANAILVAEPETDQRLAVVRIPVQLDGSRVAYLTGTAWVERPSRLFRSLLAETIRFRTGGLVFEDNQPASAVGTRLNGQLLDMGYDARNGSVVVRYDAVARGPKGAVRTKRFEATRLGIRPKPQEVGPALDATANEVARQVAEWLATGQE